MSLFGFAMYSKKDHMLQEASQPVNMVDGSSPGWESEQNLTSKRKVQKVININ